ncbi:TrkA C-terminal domain-containing protein [Peribacillus glennii]|uniref:RCK C-terminal domain-containing protein n=1 Tax=Peribacillus glennii TaxID=2303991 RepID=A0A372L9G8_9BACI|nr:TrkA C-terminal domain-containing protein [Peribacillus glennii]RFU62182.1 hypothetical protein D0466_15795 [Peribacillus glennii]
MEFLFILLYFLIITLVIEISVVLFNFTGMETKVSRFQVISMLTGTGFTTDESKVIIDHPVRRKIAAFLILFGAFSLAVIISSISNILADDLRTKELSFICAGLVIFVAVLYTPWVKKRATIKLEEEMEQHYQMFERPVKDVLYLDENDLVTDIVVSEGSKLVGRKIMDIIMKEDDISILFIQRGKVRIRRELYDSEIQEGDQIYLYGNGKEIEEKFKKELEHTRQMKEDGAT